MSEEKSRFISSLIFPALFLILIWIIKGFEILFSIDLGFLGIYPLKLSGLAGVIFAPLLHGDLGHIAANSLPVLILSFMVFYFYKGISFKVFFLTYFLSGLWVWFGARESYHIGASGLIYGLASFLFFSGFTRRDMRMSALSFVVIFLYGSMVWGVFPDFYPDRNISWEGHLSGLISGLVLAFYFRKEGPSRKKYSWELEEELEEYSTFNDEYSTFNETDSTSQKDENSDIGIKINYNYKRKTKD